MLNYDRKKVLIACIVTLILIWILLFKIFWHSAPVLSCMEKMGTSFSYEGLKMQMKDSRYEVMNKRYPGCNTNDIFLWACDGTNLETHVWSACNVGATLAYTWLSLESMSDKKQIAAIVGDFFPWGNNNGFALVDNKEKPSNLPFYTPMFTSFGWMDAPSNDWSTNTRWPCAPGYHIPSQKEWEITIALTKKSLTQTLMLPDAGILGDNGTEYNIWEGRYWTSTPAHVGKDPFEKKIPDTTPDNALAYSINMFFDTQNVFTKTPVVRTGKFSLRCIMDPAIKK